MQSQRDNHKPKIFRFNLNSRSFKYWSWVHWDIIYLSQLDWCHHDAEHVQGCDHVSELCQPRSHHMSQDHIVMPTVAFLKYRHPFIFRSILIKLFCHFLVNYTFLSFRNSNIELKLKLQKIIKRQFVSKKISILIFD